VDVTRGCFASDLGRPSLYQIPVPDRLELLLRANQNWSGLSFEKHETKISEGPITSTMLQASTLMFRTSSNGLLEEKISARVFDSVLVGTEPHSREIDR
jgi:hypothetical protein